MLANTLIIPAIAQTSISPPLKTAHSSAQWETIIFALSHFVDYHGNGY